MFDSSPTRRRTRWLRTGAALVAAVSLMVGMTATAADARTKTHTKSVVTVSAPLVNPGQGVVIAGKIVAGKKPLKRVKAKLQMRTLGVAAWSTIAVVKTNKAGKFAHAVPTALNSEFRVAYPGSKKYKASASKPKAVVVNQNISVDFTSATTMNLGDDISVTGHASAPLIGTPVALQFGSAGSWFSVASSTVAGDGSYKLAFKPSKAGAGSYRVAAGGGTGLSIAVSGPTTFTVQLTPQSIAVTSTSATTINAGDPITLSGAASSGLANSSVGLQIAGPGGWTTVNTSTIGGDGKFSVTATASQGGTIQYRAYAGGSDSLAEAASAPVTFNVYSWFALADLTKVSSSYFDVQPTETMAGTVYSKVVGSWSSYSLNPTAEWNASYKCKVFTAKIGLSDKVASGRTSRFGIAIDSAPEIDLGSLGLGQTTDVSVPITSAFRIKLFNHSTTYGSSSYNESLWANASMLCLGKP